MKFLCLAYFGPDAFAGYTPEQMRAVDDTTIEHDHKLRQSGHLLFASPLADPAAGTTIDRRRLKMSLVDGPYAETKEQLLGFYVVDCKNIDEAVDVARDLGAANPGGAYEIRPVGLFRPGSVPS